MAKKAFIYFYLVLKKMPLAGDEKNNKSAATANTDKSEQGTTKANEENTSPENNTKQKTGPGGLKNKAGGIIRNN